MRLQSAAQEGTPMKLGHTGLLDSCKASARGLSRVGDNWSVLLVIALRAGPLRFSEVKRVIGSILQRMLTPTLRSMERDGFMARTVTPTTASTTS
jgi:DNA-binding HxlR family transcriptional regulator